MAREAHRLEGCPDRTRLLTDRFCLIIPAVLPSDTSEDIGQHAGDELLSGFIHRLGMRRLAVQTGVGIDFQKVATKLVINQQVKC